jgi:isovaleryl-CoA dehydrogenase
MKTYPQLLNFGLGDTANLLRESVQDFVATEIAPLPPKLTEMIIFLWNCGKKWGIWGFSG